MNILFLGPELEIFAIVALKLIGDRIKKIHYNRLIERLTS